MVSVSVERVRGVLWVTVSCAPSKVKRASAEADKAARQWVREHRGSGYRQAFRRSSSQAVRGGAVQYRAAFALN